MKMPFLGLLSFVVALFYTIYAICYAIYNLYLHPLHEFPGPKLWIAFPILRQIAGIRGRLDESIRALHETHGPVVRISSDELSFITAQAWKDIYGHGHKQYPKWQSMPNPEASIISANDSNHARFRKALSHAFSERALRDQEPLMNTYIDLMIEKMKDVASSGQKTDMVKWYNLTTFDMIGDLAFGASFDGLKNTEYHSWVAMIFGAVKFIPYFRMASEYPIIMTIVMPLMSLMPKSVAKSVKRNIEYSTNTAMERANNEAMNGRGDFMDSMLKHRGEQEKGGLTDQELVSNAFILIIAGSETTATLLSGVTYWLLQTPKALRKATEEVRAAFENESDINFTNASARLQYMLACLGEGLRMYPPIPSGLHRIVPAGETAQISGYQIPGKTKVAVHQSAAYWSASNFHDPHSFIPERWLPDASKPESPYCNDNRAVLQPFSVGPRNCLGRNLAYNEMRLILARVLWNFDLELCEESQKWNHQKIFLLWEKPALMCRLRVRSD